MSKGPFAGVLLAVVLIPWLLGVWGIGILTARALGFSDQAAGNLGLFAVPVGLLIAVSAYILSMRCQNGSRNEPAPRFEQ